MKDITTLIKEVSSKNIIWGVDVFYAVIEQLRSKGYYISFWDNEENWATIIFDDKIIGYLWNKFPLAFVISQYVNDISISLKAFDCVIFIEVNNLTSKELKIDYNDLKDKIDFGIDYDGFSAEDLWFYTNSI